MAVSLLSILRAASPTRHHKAVTGLADGSLTITITHRSDIEMRALVRNGEGTEYGVVITEHGGFCGCKDFAYRGVVCYHQIALCVYVLQQNEATENRIHLWLPTATAAVCGTKTARRIATCWFDTIARFPETCPACRHVWAQPVGVSRDEHYFDEAQNQRRAA
jgi:hypothetical protein